MKSGVLFKKGYLVPMLRCVVPLQANYVIREIHMGSCGLHVGPRAVVRKAIRQGYYWPTMHEDAKEEVQKYDSCQIHAPALRLPKTLMTSIMAPWTFYQWGMDILGPLSPAKGGAKFVIMTINYFTKWIEANPLVAFTALSHTLFYTLSALTNTYFHTRAWSWDHSRGEADVSFFLIHGYARNLLIKGWNIAHLIQYEILLKHSPSNGDEFKRLETVTFCLR
ncbi:reverse transcriptase domain-containing protein [Tanacetum coccineum]